MPHLQENITIMLMMFAQLPSSVLVLLGVALITITLMLTGMSKH